MSRKEKSLQFADDIQNIQITGRHVQVTEAMKAYAIDKVSKIKLFSDRVIDINVILDIQRYEHRAEIIMKVANTKILSRATTDNMYVSIDQAVERIESQLKRYKAKLQNHHAKSLNDVDMNVNVIRRPLSEQELDEEYLQMELNGKFIPHEVVSQEKHPLKTLNLDEAVMKMELSGNTFLIYKSEEDQKLKVIYRRNDGNYGIIEPSC